MNSTSFRHTESDLDRFREVQRLAYDCAEHVADWLEPGVTERQAADRLRRELILREVRAGRPLSEVYAAVDGLIARHGFDNRHRVYPGRVIGHQVTRMHSRGPAGVTVLGFGVRTIQTLGRELLSERRHGRSPLWADGRASRHAPTSGLWAVEPHVGLRDVGMKFEELLVVTEDDAYWLDDDVPHVRRWMEGAAR